MDYLQVGSDIHPRMQKQLVRQCLCDPQFPRSRADVIASTPEKEEMKKAGNSATIVSQPVDFSQGVWLSTSHSFSIECQALYRSLRREDWKCQSWQSEQSANPSQGISQPVRGRYRAESDHSMLRLSRWCAPRRLPLILPTSGLRPHLQRFYSQAPGKGREARSPARGITGQVSQHSLERGPAPL